MIILPNMKWLFVIFIVSLIFPIHYFLLFNFPQEDKVFVGYPDDALMLTLMKSSKWNFDDPWSFDGGKVWHNPLIGAVYLFILLGLIPTALNINLYLAFVIFKFLFTFAYYIVAYNLIILFLKKERNIAFAVFMFYAGIGGLLYIFSLLFFGQTEYLSIIGYAFTNEFNELAASSHSLTHIFRLYYVIPEILGYLAIIFFVKNRKLLAGLSLGLVFLFYPMYGVGFSIVLLLYQLSKNNKINIIKPIKELAPTYFTSAFFLLPWLIASSQRAYYYDVSKLFFENLPTISIFIGFFFSLFFATYYLSKNRSRLLKKSEFVLFSLLVLAAFTIRQLFEISQRSPIFNSWLELTKLNSLVLFLQSFSLQIEIITLILAFVLVYSILRKEKNQINRFLFSWLFVFLVLSGVEPSTFQYLVSTGRLAALLLFPISVIASLGLLRFSKDFKIRPYIVVFAVILLSIPSLIGYNFWLQKSVREAGVDAFFTKDEYAALTFLKTQPYGAVISSLKFGTAIPYYTDKKSVLFVGRNNEGKLQDAHNDYSTFFFADADNETRLSIIKKYNLTYVVFGKDEKGISNGIFNPENLTYLKKIYNGSVEIYKVI